MDFNSFFWGFTFCLFCFLIFSISDYLVEKAFTLREQRESKKDGTKH